ncbi:6-pyruvoyl-tetrahydropterin synthase-related protein, partial [Patescibacteria group bacterium]|nr:6-pyruvoyl-tetrahydropterin synthase-related protein [Patescibacteria group bacterium]
MKLNINLRSLIFPGLLLAIAVVLATANYVPGTYLSGWDTLHPEFNFGLYFKRTLFGVWQEHQGLGAVAAQSHAGDLPRLLIYYPLSFLLSENFLRWAYFFICLFLGPLGVYFFLKHITNKSWIGYSAGLLYLLNLGTLQHFYLPFEMFATHFATLAWLFLFAVRFLENGNRKDLIFFSLVTLLSTPTSHTPTLFYVYFLALCLFLFANICVYRKRYIRSILILFVTIAINSFWLLPNIYFIVNHNQDVLNSKTHSQLFYRAFYTSKEFATLPDASLIRGYLFDWGRYDFSKRSFVDLFAGWKIYLSNPFIKSLGYLVFITVVLGIIISFLKRNKIALVFFPLFLLSFFAIATNLEFLSSINILREALRFLFTKFSILLMFMFAFYFGISLEFLGVQLGKIIKKERMVAAILVSIVTISLILYMLPAFSGDLISKSEKVNIPKEYFQTFNFLNEQKAGRVADFPVHTFWGWVYYSWGYEGAGFLWFGLDRPLLDREFDRWSPYNENYYWEISYAVYSKNLKLVEAVLDKYQINWLLVDESVFDPSSSKAVFTDELEGMLSGSRKITFAKTFGKIKIYKVDLAPQINNYISLSENLPFLGPQYQWTNLDKAYLENGNYISIPESRDQQLNPDIYYPFRSLFTNRSQQDLEFSVQDKGDYFTLGKKLPQGFNDYYIEVPEINDQDLTWVDPKDLSKIKNLPKDIFFNGQFIEVKIPKVGGLFSSEIIAGDKREFWLQYLPHNLSYLISIDSKNLQGKPLNFWLENLNSRRADIENYLPARPAGGPKSDWNTSFFIQPPMEKDGLGYALHFDQLRFGNEVSQNELGKIKVYPVSFDFLTGLKLRKVSSLPQQKSITVSAEHPNPSMYIVTIAKQETVASQSSTLVLSQSYERGWRAYEITNSKWGIVNHIKESLPLIFGRKIKNHILV